MYSMTTAGRPCRVVSCSTFTMLSWLSRASRAALVLGTTENVLIVYPVGFHDLEDHGPLDGALSHPRDIDRSKGAFSEGLNELGIVGSAMGRELTTWRLGSLCWGKSTRLEERTSCTAAVTRRRCCPSAHQFRRARLPL